MGILNVTPDSFSDGGRWSDPSVAVEHAMEMVDAGAAIIDVGAESTRPGSESVSEETELSRLVPVLRELIPNIDVPVSVDTMKARVADRCLSMGAEVINDVYGLRDPGMLEVCADAGAYVVIMHMGETVEDSHASVMGGSFMEDIRGFLRSRTSAALEAGIADDRIILDPGIGFGKTMEQNARLLDSSSFFSDGHPVLSGSSRKRVISHEYPGMDPDLASAEAARRAADSGADIVRVHDVASTARRLSL